MLPKNCWGGLFTTVEREDEPENYRCHIGVKTALEYRSGIGQVFCKNCRSIHRDGSTPGHQELRNATQEHQASSRLQLNSLNEGPPSKVGRERMDKDISLGTMSKRYIR